MYQGFNDVCDECGVAFRTVEDLDKHQLDHHEKNEKEFYVGELGLPTKRVWPNEPNLDPLIKRIKLTNSSTWTEVLPSDELPHETSYQVRVFSGLTEPDVNLLEGRDEDVKIEPDTRLSEIEVVELHNNDASVKVEDIEESSETQLIDENTTDLAEIRQLCRSIISPLANSLMEQANETACKRRHELKRGKGILESNVNGLKEIRTG